MTIKQIHETVSLDTVMGEWLDGYTSKDGKIVYSEWYLDAVKGVAIFLLTIDIDDAGRTK